MVKAVMKMGWPLGHLSRCRLGELKRGAVEDGLIAEFSENAVTFTGDPGVLEGIKHAAEAPFTSSLIEPVWE